MKKVILALVLSLMVLALALAAFGGSETKENAGFDIIVPAYAGKGGVDTSAAAATLMEAETGRILFSHGKDIRLPMASTTKIMTAAVAIEYGDMDAVTTVSAEAVGVEGSSIYLTVGERFTQKELLYALLLESGNDAAVALAIAVAGDVDSFVSLMNRKAAELGLTGTSFKNPHGLSAEGHYTTAAELAAITAYALKLPLFEEIVSTVSTRLEGEGHTTRYLVNHNRLLRSYKGLIGVKTGYTMAAGRCLVTAARRGGMTLVAVTLNDRNDWEDHAAMLDYGFSAFRMETLCKAGDCAAVPVTGGKKASVLAVCNETVRLCTPTDSKVERLYTVDAVAAPIEKGQSIAKLKIYENGTLVREIALTAKEAVPIKKKGFFD